MDSDDVVALSLNFTCAVELNGAHATALITCTVGEQPTVVRRVLQREPGPGLRTWQELVKWYRPTSATEAATSVMAIIAPPRARGLVELHRSIMEWG